MSADLQVQFREIIDILEWECVEDRGFEPPFSIHVTDASGYAFSAAFVEDPDHGHPKLFGIKAPQDLDGVVADHTLVFPLRVVASDHAGRTHRADFQRIQ